LQENNKLILFSDLGHGKTKSTNQQILGYKIIEKLTESTGKNSVILIGLSWRAMICVDYVLNNPKKVEKLILVSPGLNGWNYFQDTIAAKNNLLRKEASSKNDIDSAAILFHKNWVIGPRRNPNEIENEFHKESLRMITSNMKEHWKEDWSKLDSIPAIERLEEIEVPTFIIIGNQDAEDILLIANEYDDRIPNSTKIVMDNVAHLLNMEQAENFNRILNEILND